MREDLIDFPVSDAWRDFYYEAGLTPFPSPSYLSRRDGEMAAHLERIERLLARLVEEVAHIRQARPAPRETGRKGAAKRWHTPTASSSTAQSTS